MTIAQAFRIEAVALVALGSIVDVAILTHSR